MTATTADSAAETPAPARLRPLLPERMRPRNRPLLWLELAFTVGLYLAYSRTRRYVPRHKSAAIHRAHEVLHTEQLLHVDFELTVNRAVSRIDWLVDAMNYYYATLHFFVTPSVLIWLYVCRPAYYRSVRTALYVATLLALIGFTFFALAPPRFLASHGFIDTIVTHRTWGSWDSGKVSTVSNQYAAMPSVHIVWSAWAGLTVAHLARHTWVRVLGICYPLATFVVIISTANHFFADAVGGAAVLALGFGIQRLLTGRAAYRLPDGDLSDDPLGASPGAHPLWRRARRTAPADPEGASPSDSHDSPARR